MRPPTASALVRFMTVVALLSTCAAISSANSIPYVDQPLVPTSMVPGGAGFTLTVNGAGFTATSTVQWNGSARPTTFVNGGRLTAVISAADVAFDTTANITVANPGPGGGISNTVFFQVRQQSSSLTYGSSTVSAGLPQNVFVSQVVEGDFNGDGKPDIATLNTDVSVTILLGNGDGTFQPPSNSGRLTFQPNVGALLIAVGDFNGDGKLDLAVLHSFFDDIQGAGNEILVLLGNGNGSFGSPIHAFRSTGFAFTSTFLAADLNQRGTLDLVMDEGLSGCGLLVLGGNGDGTFTPRTTISCPAGAGGGGIAAAVAEVNGDGNLDVIMAIGGVLAVALGNGAFTVPCPFCPPTPPFQPATIVDTISGAGALAVAAADFDGDGIPDLAFVFQTCISPNPCTGHLQTYLGIGNGTFKAGVPSGGALAPAGNLIVGDFNGDGILDVAYSNDVLLGRGDGTFAVNTVFPPQTGAILAADFNGDGALDFFGGSAQGALLLQLQILPNFSVSFASTTGSAVIGQSAHYGITVTPSNGFTSDVQLNVTGLPPNSSASFSSNPVTGGSGSTTLTISTTSSTPAGHYFLTVTATGGSLAHSTGIILDVLAPDFSLTFANTTASTPVGGSATYGINVTPLNGFTGSVQFNVTGLPPNSSASFSSNPVTGGSGSTTLTVSTTSSTPAGRYFPTLTAASGGLAHSTILLLDVTDFSLSFANTTASTPIGGSATYGINVTPLNGFTGSVQFNVTGLPPHSSVSFSPNPVTGGSGSTTLTISTTSSTPEGRYSFTVTGASGGLAHSAVIILDVKADFSISVTPQQQTVSLGHPARFQGTVTPLFGFNGNVSLSISGLPANTTLELDPLVVTGGSGTFKFTISANSKVAPGTYTVTIRGTSGAQTSGATITLVVQ